MSDIRQWLEELGLGQYADAFEAREIAFVIAFVYVPTGRCLVARAHLCDRYALDTRPDPAEYSRRCRQHLNE